MSANFLLCFSPHTVNDPLNSPHCCSEAAQSSKSHMNAFWEVKEAISFTNTFAFTMRCSFNVFFVCAPISSFCRERWRSEGTSLTLNTSHVKRAALWLQTVPPRQVVYRRLKGEPSLADRMAECQQVTQVCNNGLTLQSPLQLMWEGYAPKEAALTSAGEHRE